MATTAKSHPSLITRDDWLKALADTTQEQVETDPSIVSYNEFADLLGVAYGTARKRLNGLVKSGRAHRVMKRTLTADGRCRNVIAFKLLKK